MPESHETIEVLEDQLIRLNDELRVIRDVMNEIREQLTWGLQNGRVFLTLVDPDERAPQADAELEGHTIDLAIRLQSSLTTFARDIAEAVKPQRSEEFIGESVCEPATPAVVQPQQLPEITLFEAGDQVEILYEGTQRQAEILELDDAQNIAIIELIESQTQVEVQQDELKPVTPQRKEGAAQTEFSINDVVRFELESVIWQGEIVTLTADDEAIVSLPEQSDYVHVPLDLLTKMTQSAISDHERWCNEVRNPANERSEGCRGVSSSDGHAQLEYEIAQLSENRWAVTWQYGFHCGDHTGHARPWTEYSSRDECLQEMLGAVTEFFSKQRDNAAQQRVRLEILDRIGSGLFGFQEPTPVQETKQPTKPVKSL